MTMTQEQTEWLTLEQAAEFAGKSVSVIRWYIAKGFIKKYKRPIDRHVYIRADELMEFLTRPPEVKDDEKSEKP